jgi:hypothetical protein
MAALWESVLRHDGFAAFAGRVPEQLIRWEAGYGWTRRGYGQLAEKETPLAVPLARLVATPDMWRTFTESYLKAVEAAGPADPRRSLTGYGTSDETSYRPKERVARAGRACGMKLRYSDAGASLAAGPGLTRGR